MSKSTAGARSRANNKARDNNSSNGGLEAALPDDYAYANGSLNGSVNGSVEGGKRGGQGRSTEETWNMVLLVVLYTVQAVPMGLAMGAIPFMLQAKLSYTQMGIFSLAAYPYSMKLLWSPIVDCVFHPAVGRRKSWIIPIQLTTSALFFTCGPWVQERMEAADVAGLTGFFLLLVLLSATQDIAVDGWALTLLEEENVGYASSCQTLGANIGFFSSFTIFLALNNPDFCNSYIRSRPLLQSLLGLDPTSTVGVVSLQQYLQFWGVLFFLVTVAVALFKPERKEPVEPTAGAPRSRAQEVLLAYQQLWRVVKLPAVLQLSVLLITYRLAVLPAEGAASLKLLDKGVSKESLAFLVLLQFPVELGSAVLAGRWAAVYSPYKPFIAGYCLRMLMSLCLTLLVASFPLHATSITQHWLHFGMLSAIGLTTSFVSTLMFTSLGCFFNTISDPLMGGAYLTLLNTISNMGIVLPKTPMFYLMDAWTVAQCRGKGGEVLSYACPKKMKDAQGDNACTANGGSCSLVSDGFYAISFSMLTLGVLLCLLYMRLFPRLIKLPQDKWRAPATKSLHAH